MAVAEDDELFCWGAGTRGECGYGEFYSVNKPQRVTLPEVGPIKNEPIRSISAGGHHSLVLTTTGYVFSFGHSSHGQLGLKTTTNHCSPQLVKDLTEFIVTQISAGWNHSLVLTQSGKLFASGHGEHGQLGLGDHEIQKGFTNVAQVGNKNIGQIYAGGNHSWLVLDDQDPIRIGPAIEREE